MFRHPDAWFWLVLSNTVMIQGHSHGGGGRIVGIQMRGAWLGNHILRAEKQGNSHSHNAQFVVTWDNRRILTRSTETQTPMGGVVLKRMPKNTMTPKENEVKKMAPKGKDKYFINQLNRITKGGHGGSFYFKLPHGVELFFSGADGMVLLIKIPRIPNMAGYCGNWNGNANDDFPKNDGPQKALMKDGQGWPSKRPRPAPRTAASLRRRYRSLSLFGVSLSEPADSLADELGETVKEPESSDDALDVEMTNCTVEAMKKAEQHCHHLPDITLRNDCILDFCLSGDTESTDENGETIFDDSAMALMMKVEFGHDVPVFDGNGKCLDQDGKEYTSFTTKLETQQECMDALSKSTKLGGIRGAQIAVGQKCQLLVDAESKRPSISYAGNWGDKRDGTGIVATNSKEDNWACFKLDR